MALVRYPAYRKLFRDKRQISFAWICVDSVWQQNWSLSHMTTMGMKVKPGMPVYIDDPFIRSTSEVIDVRTPNEYEEDHIPGAINLPVLTDTQRHEVGLRYSQNSFDGRKLGAQVISRNISDHLEGHFHSKTNDYSPLIYCWRGGQRSYSLGLVLAQIGFQVHILQGGYKHYRKLVRQDLQQLPTDLNFKVISGLTGCGKTMLLKKLQLCGEQVLDLEDLAKHKGSVLGSYPGQGQPSQKLWESLLRREISSFNPQRPIWVESESRRIGTRNIPDDLFARMRQGKCFKLDVPMSARVKYIIKDYPYWMTGAEEIKKNLGILEKYMGKERIQLWFRLIDEQRWEEFVEDILVEHYDKTYKSSQQKNFQVHFDGLVEVLPLAELSDDIVSSMVQNLITQS